MQNQRVAELTQRLDSIRSRIVRACSAVGRDPSEVCLIAVTKNVPMESIREAYNLGLRDFGESRLQEALPKIEKLPKDITWHFIGTMQSNKARRIASEFPVIHTLCKASQLIEIAKAGRVIDGLIEINVANEPQKAGISYEGLDEFVRQVLTCREVRLRGLMTIGPVTNEPEVARQYFRRLKDGLRWIPGGDWLSMGMSDDFEVAIQEGSTHIRVGSALFGERKKTI